MKIIVEIYRGKYRIDACQINTQDLSGRPKILPIQIANYLKPPKAKKKR